MEFNYTYFSIHELGKRENQEDALFPNAEKGDSEDSNGLFILCDGMGGHEHGEIASDTVCNSISEVLAAKNRRYTRDDFEAAISHAYDALDAKDGQESDKQMGTTIAFVKFFESGCFVAHIGDSRVYHIRPGADKENRIRFVTKDHSLVNDLIALGEMTPEEAKYSKYKNILTRAMQPNLERRYKADVVLLADIQEGDYIFMCSDGMLEVTSNEELANIISMRVPDEKKIEILKNVTSENKDNHSAFMIHITSTSENLGSASKRQILKRTVFPIEGVTITITIVLFILIVFSVFVSVFS